MIHIPTTSKVSKYFPLETVVWMCDTSGNNSVKSESKKYLTIFGSFSHEWRYLKLLSSGTVILLEKKMKEGCKIVSNLYFSLKKF